MKNIFLFIVIYLIAQSCHAYTTWDNSPYNWNNSEYNYQNSSSNFQNSPNNWNNSMYNPNANLIYDNYGNPQGYAVPKSNGTGVNVFDFNGNRRNYYNY